MLFIEINNKLWISQIIVKENDVQFAICDLTELFLEKITKKELLERAGKINNTRIKVLETVLNKFEESADEYQLQESNGNCKLSLKYNVDGGRPFKFHWDLRKCTAKEFSAHFSNPLLKHLMEQELKIKELKETITAKDKEIDQYKMSGAQLIIDSMATEKFNDTNFQQKWDQFAGTKDDNSTFNLPELLVNENVKKVCTMLSIENVFEKKIVPAHKKESPTNKSPGKGKRRRLLMQKERISRKPKKIEFNSSQELIESEDYSETLLTAMPSTSNGQISQTQTQPSQNNAAETNEMEIPRKKPKKTLDILRELGI